MKLKTLINKALKENPIPANTPCDRAIIVFLDDDNTVFSLGANLTGSEVTMVLEHVLAGANKKVLSQSLILKG